MILFVEWLDGSFYLLQSQNNLWSRVNLDKPEEKRTCVKLKCAASVGLMSLSFAVGD